MNALIINLRLNSLFSIRIPYTWQSSLTYPILPPSSIIGLLANALQRYKNNKHPLEYLKLIEENVISSNSKLLSPLIIKSYTVSTIVKWEEKISGKFTNALGRQFAFTQKLQVVTIFKDDFILSDIMKALKCTSITCGDSESPAIVEEIYYISDLTPKSDNIIATVFPFRFENGVKILSGSGRIFPFHERCLKVGKEFPLIMYLCPMKEKDNVLYPDKVQIQSEKPLKYFQLEKFGSYIFY